MVYNNIVEQMTDNDITPEDESRESDSPPLPADDEPWESVEAYEADGGVVFYDAQNPLAWLQTTLTIGLQDNR